MSKRVKPWRELVEKAAIEQMAREMGFSPFTGPVRLDIEFHTLRPRSHYRTGRFEREMRTDAPARWKSTSPDVSKMVRSTEDAITSAGLWLDDRLVADLHAADVWVDRFTGTEGAIVTITELED